MRIATAVERIRKTDRNVVGFIPPARRNSSNSEYVLLGASRPVGVNTGSCSGDVTWSRRWNRRCFLSIGENRSENWLTFSAVPRNRKPRGLSAKWKTGMTRAWKSAPK